MAYFGNRSILVGFDDGLVSHDLRALVDSITEEVVLPTFQVWLFDAFAHRVE